MKSDAHAKARHGVRSVHINTIHRDVNVYVCVLNNTPIIPLVYYAPTHYNNMIFINIKNIYNLYLMKNKQIRYYI